MTTRDLEHLLRETGLRVTRPRLAVLRAVHNHPHAVTESVIGALRRDLPAVSHQAVYDSLHALTTAGLVRRIQPARAVARDDARLGDDDRHGVGRSCGALADAACAAGAAPCLTAPGDHGFVIEEAEVVYWGACPTCAVATPSAAPS